MKRKRTEKKLIAVVEKAAHIFAVAILSVLILHPAPAAAQESVGWPPFDLDARIEPLENNRLKIIISFDNEISWPMTDFTIKIPLPAGTRFVEASAPPTTGTSFDGRELTFLTNTIGPKGSVEGSYFIVESTIPGQTLLKIRPWVSWKGDYAGDYLLEEITLDAGAPFLDWQRPYANVQLYSRATILDDLITYFIYEVNIGRGRIWDTWTKIAIPPEANFLRTEASSNFTVSFTGQEVNFFTLELPREVVSGPLIIKMQARNQTAPFIYVQPYVFWTNVSTGLPQAEMVAGGTTILQPGLAQWVVTDATGDVPEGAYDLTNLSLQRDGETLKITLYTADDLALLGTGSRYRVYLDTDCNVDTGEVPWWRNNFGMDYRINYDRTTGRARFQRFNPEINDWDLVTDLGHWADRTTITTWLPYVYLAGIETVCWSARADSPTSRYFDFLPDTEGPELTHYEVNWDVTAEITNAAAITTAPAN